MFVQVAASKGKTVEVESSAPGGYTFENHSTNATTLSLISSRDWDFVVLQEQSQMPSFPPSQVESDVYPYAETLCDLIRTNSRCTIPLFFMTWGRKNGDSDNCQFYPPICTYLGMQWRLRQSYVEMAEDNDAWVAPVGMAYKSVITSNPEIELFSGDESHPSVCGTYLAACTFYSVIFNETPVGAYKPTQVSDDQAVVIQNAAWNVVMDSLNIWRIDTTTVRADFEPVFLTKTVAAQFENYSENADSCLWDFGDGSEPVMQYPINNQIYDWMYHTYPEEAEYNICLTAYKGCAEDMICKARFIYISSKQEIEKEVLSVYPNPVENGVLNLVNPIRSSYRIIDISGKIVFEGNISNNPINVSSLKAGIYFLKCEKQNIKFIVK